MRSERWKEQATFQLVSAPISRPASSSGRITPSSLPLSDPNTFEWLKNPARMEGRIVIGDKSIFFVLWNARDGKKESKAENVHRQVWKDFLLLASPLRHGDFVNIERASMSTGREYWKIFFFARDDFFYQSMADSASECSCAPISNPGTVMNRKYE